MSRGRPPLATMCRETAELIRARGWAHHQFHGPRGELCMLSALTEVMHKHGWCMGDAGKPSCDISKPIEKVLGASLINFNDRQGQTQEAVLAALERAAEKLA